MKQTLLDTLSSRFTSPDNTSDAYKKKWYHYGVSQKNGKHTWMCTVIDFSASAVIGGLTTSARYSDKAGNIHIYKIEAAFRGERLVSFYSPPIGHESIAVEIMPFMGNAFQHYYAGVAFLQTCDGNHSLIPVLMSEQPMFDVQSAGDAEESLNDKFNEAWISGFKNINPLLPLPGKNNGVTL